MKFATLYGKDSAGKLKLWEVFTEGNAVVVRHGKLDGKIQEKVTYCEAKNVGRSNETSPEQQAILEAEAKWVKQKKKGYFETKEDALGFVDKTPMKAQNYNAHADKVEYDCYIQPKLNGRRLMLDENGNGQSKQGEANHILPHWKDDLAVLSENNLLSFGADGEVFEKYQKQGGLSLQEIGSAYLKPNENTPRLKYWIYDIPCDTLTQEERCEILGRISDCIIENGLMNIVVVPTFVCISEAQGDALYKKWVKEGAEGAVYRKKKAMYEFGKRSYSLIKRKPRDTAEAKVLSSRIDKNGEGVLTCVLQNGGTFECKMRVDSHPTINYRKYENSLTLIGKFIEFEYEELSDSGKPTKGVGVGIRNVNENWEAVE